MTVPFEMVAGIVVLVADARKAMVLVNAGDSTYPNLQVRETMNAAANPKTSNQGSDRPGRTAVGARRSAVGQTDWHQAAEDEFAVRVSRALDTFDDPPAIVVVAPPKFLAALRKHVSKATTARVVAEIAKDLTHLPVSEIEAALRQ